MLEWRIVYEIELNPIKSGILRVLNRAGKIKGIKNIAKIPEVTEYKYLGLTINQSLNFKGLTSKIKSKSNYMREQINKIKYTALSPKALKLILKTIYYQMITYGCTSVYPRNVNYRKWLNSALYQLTKNIFGVRGNPSKEILFKLLNNNLICMIFYNVYGWDGAESCENHRQKDDASWLAIPNT